MGVWRDSGWGRSVEIAGHDELEVRSLRLPLLDRSVSTIRVQFAVALVVLNLCDVLLTKVVLHLGGIEGNPLMKDLMAGFAAPLGVKALFAAVAGLLLFLCPAESRFADRAVATVAGLYLGIVVWNSALVGWLLIAG
ncbi:MAG TPA: DUF5658 family protein [Microthrixaceae bacterium]|nr:DUF5658 family protein [Microthrixaceae bacterium]